MVVNSVPFLLFFVVVFAIYYLPIVQQRLKLRNTWLCIASYFFYGYADLRMLPLLLCSSAVFYGLGLWIKKTVVTGKWKVASRLTTMGVCLGVGVLFYFKYFNFFASEIASLLRDIGFNVSWTTMNIIIPVGVSFFTFKLISYVVEIHREHIEPTMSFIDFATYVAFFPTILSGPIDRPNKFIPQLERQKAFDYTLAVDGCRQILWGVFTKMCIADNIGMFTDSMWDSYATESGINLLGGVLLYPIQLYADFSGYSDMAIGVSKILGFNVARNFNHPFIARNIAEYWRRWHMSLTSWITDYVFMPLNISFRNLGQVGIIIAVITDFVVIGFWHGANWTYGLFGLYHGLLFIPLILMGKFGKNKKIKANKYGLPYFRDFILMILTFFLVMIGNLMFRAPDVYNLEGYAIRMLVGLSSMNFHFWSLNGGYETYLFIITLLTFEWVGRKVEHPLQLLDKGIFVYFPVRLILYIGIVLMIIFFSGVHSDFIYFKF